MHPGAGEVASCVRALTALAKDLGSVPNAQMEALQSAVSPVPGDQHALLASVGTRNTLKGNTCFYKSHEASGLG